MKILDVSIAYFPVIGGAENNGRHFSEILASTCMSPRFAGAGATEIFK
jgi:hypothetical protein